MAEIEQKLQEIEQQQSRLSTAKANLKTAITGKGVDVPDSAKLDEYSSFVDEIQQGGAGGTDNVAGVLVDDGNGGLLVQKLSFDGTSASDDGEPVSADKFYIFTTGKAEPNYGRAMEIYKCVYVDSVNKTWSGYLAVLSGDVYSFADTITENLTYGNGYTPVPEGIYDKEAMVTVAGLWMGLPSE